MNDIRQKCSRRPSHRRQGSILVLMVALLPVLFILCAIGINVAQQQLVRTELKIATDSAARAGGSAWSLTNDPTTATQFAIDAAAANQVQGTPLTLTSNDVQFGNSTRDGALGRFVFTPNPGNGVGNGQITTALRVSSTINSLLPFRISGIENINQHETSVASQVDRDIALVVDRSGSMAYFEDEDFLFDTITHFYNQPNSGISDAEYDAAVADYQPVARLAAMALRDRAYSADVISHLSGDLLEYAITLNSDYRTETRAPRQSRWAVLEQATTAFFDTLELSATNERVSVSSFASGSSLDLPLTFDLQAAKQTVLGLYPNGSTAIGRGMQTAIDDLLASRRSSAIPTILIFSDGENKQKPYPVDVANQIIADNPNVVINTITFAGGDQTEMAEVASIGGGTHYHAEDGAELVEVFREIARSFSTVITE